MRLLQSPPTRTRSSIGPYSTTSPSNQAATIRRFPICSRTRRTRRKAKSVLWLSHFSPVRTASPPHHRPRSYSLGLAGHARALTMGHARQCPTQWVAFRSDRRRHSAPGRESVGMQRIRGQRQGRADRPSRLWQSHS